MQVGVGSQVSPNSNNRSVGQRIKEASLKEIVQLNSASNNNVNSNNVNNLTDDDSLDFHTVHISADNYNNGTNYSLNGDKVGRNGITSMEPQLMRKTSTVVLSEIQRNTIRIIGQYLRDLGLTETVDSLVEESGCRIESALCGRLQEYVIEGEWTKALDVVDKMSDSITEKQYLTVRYLHALRLLQIEYPNNKEFKKRAETLATMLLSSPPSEKSPNYGSEYDDDEQIMENETNGTTSGECSKSVSNKIQKRNYSILMALQKILPPNFLLPLNRLKDLIKQSWIYQLEHCQLHFMEDDEEMDGRVLNQHCQVWCLEFSPCGQFLASGAKDNSVYIWQVLSPQKIQHHLRLQIPRNIDGISSMSWSSDSQYLAVASTEDMDAGVYIFNVAKGVLHKEYKPAQCSFSVVSFFANSTYNLTCGDQKGHFHFHNIDHTDDEQKTFEGFRIRNIYGMKDGKSVLAADTHNRQYDFETSEESTIITESSQIMYFTVSPKENYILVTTKSEGLRLWCLKTRCLIRSFFGSYHDKFVVSSAFGGHNSNFIASGSEDNFLVIWNVDKSEPIYRLAGHEGVVNAASWNPVYHNMLASGSDDNTIRIWSSLSTQNH